MDIVVVATFQDPGPRTGPAFVASRKTEQTHNLDSSALAPLAQDFDETQDKRFRGPGCDRKKASLCTSWHGGILFGHLHKKDPSR